MKWQEKIGNGEWIFVSEAWAGCNRITSAIPPAGATKRGREDMETQLMVGLATKIFDLQRAGLNLRAVAIGGK